MEGSFLFTDFVLQSIQGLKFYVGFQGLLKWPSFVYLIDEKQCTGHFAVCAFQEIEVTCLPAKKYDYVSRTYMAVCLALGIASCFGMHVTYQVLLSTSLFCVVHGTCTCTL